MQIEETKFEDRIQLDVSGRIDVTNAPALQEAILLAFQKSSKISINLENTEYVSSAGLRAFLIGQKTASSKGGTMVLLNVPGVVKEVMDTTGFSSIFTFSN